MNMQEPTGEYLRLDWRAPIHNKFQKMKPTRTAASLVLPRSAPAAFDAGPRLGTPLRRFRAGSTGDPLVPIILNPSKGRYILSSFFPTRLATELQANVSSVMHRNRRNFNLSTAGRFFAEHLDFILLYEYYTYINQLRIPL